MSKNENDYYYFLILNFTYSTFILLTRFHIFFEAHTQSRKLILIKIWKNVKTGYYFRHSSF